MVAPISVNILYNKGSQYGLTEDVQLIEKFLGTIRKDQNVQISKTRHVDLREPNVHCDIQFHLEIPIFGAIPWAHTNIVIVNPDHWNYAYDAYLHAFDAIICKDITTTEKFKADLSAKGIHTDNIYCVHLQR